MGGYLVLHIVNSEIFIVSPENCSQSYFSSRENENPRNVKNFEKIHKYSPNDYQIFQEIVSDTVLKIKYHNNSINENVYNLCK